MRKVSKWEWFALVAAGLSSLIFVLPALVLSSGVVDASSIGWAVLGWAFYLGAIAQIGLYVSGFLFPILVVANIIYFVKKDKRISWRLILAAALVAPVAYLLV